MNTKLIISLLAISLTLCAIGKKDKEALKHFEEFVKKFGKQYNTIEESMRRFEIFKANFYSLEHLSEEGYTLTLTKFSDLTPQEFKKTYLNVDTTPLVYLKSRYEDFVAKSDPAPESHNFVELGAVTDAKEQGSCKSCWAFSAIANLEGAYKIKHGELLTFSEQQLVDCDQDISNGCNGGETYAAFEYIHEVGGIQLAKDYPYTDSDGTCKFDSSKVALKVDSYIRADRNEEHIKQMLFENGPLSVSIDASSLQFYSGGILGISRCSPRNLNHGVALVGYGVEDGKKFWIVKNSWGKNWGENGFFRIVRGQGACGINIEVYAAIIQ